MRLVNWRSLAIAAAGFGLAACGDDVTVTPTPISFTTNPASVSCVAGTTTAVGLSVAGGAGTPTVTFQASGTGFTVAQNGNSATITCTTAGAGAVNFTITSGGQTVTGSIPVTVTAAGNQSPVTSVAVSPTNATIVPGGTVQLTAQVTLASGAPATTSTAVTWSSSDTTVATVSPTGLVTAKTTAAGRSAVISATSVANTNLQGRSAITVGPASSLVSGLTVSPGSVVLTTGQTQQITSNVTLAAGAPSTTSTAVTFTSSDTSVATVSSTGVITAGSRAGVATITIASVAAPTVTQTIGVTVSQLTPVRLTIQGLQTFNAAGQAVVADPTNVAGRLVATLNLDPGSFTPDSVVATLGGQRVVCQRFTAQLAQALRSALTDGSADFAPIQCTINTSSFNATTGAPDVLNGNQTFNATVFYRPVGGGVATTQTATIPVQLTLNNQSGYFVSVTNTPTAAQVANGAPANGQATGPQGVLWRGGDLTVSAIPVFFTPAQGQTGTQSIAISLQDIVSGQIATKTVTAAAGAAFSTTFGGKTASFAPVPNNVTAGCQCLDGYTSPNAGQLPLGTAGGTAGTQVVIGGGANTVVLNSNGVPQASGPVVYIDNAAPEARNQFVGTSFLLNGAGQQGFLNGTFDPSASVSQAAAATALADNNGVDRVTRAFFFANTSAGLTASGTTAANQVAALQNGAFTVPTNTTLGQYQLAAKLADALGNATSTFVTAGAAGPTFQFGVSTAAPTLTVGGSATNNGQFNAASGTRTITGTVTSPVGFGANPLLVTLTRVSPAGTFCAQASDVVGGTVNGATLAQPAGGCTAVAANSVAIDATTAAEGIYTATIQARDVAGNVSGTFTRTFVIDRTAPVVANPAPAAFPLKGGIPQTFTASATDNMNLVNQYALVNYPVAAPFTIRYDGNAIASAFATPFTRSATLSVTTGNFLRSVAQALFNGAGPGQFTNVVAGNVNPAVAVGGVSLAATDGGNNVGFGQIPPPTVFALLDQTQVAGNAFFSANPATGLQSASVTYTTAAGTSAAQPALGSTTVGTSPSVTINLVQNGPANTPFTSAFTRIDVFQQVATPAGSPYGAPTYTFLGSAAQGGLTVTPTTSTIASSFTFTPTSFPTAGTTTADLLVIAYDANGNALSFTLPTITINP